MLKKILLICMISLLAFGDAGIVLPSGWVQPEGYTRTISMSARVVGIDGNTFVETVGSTLAAFGADGTCRGLAAGEATANGTFIYSLSISSNLAIENGITLKILDAQAGEVYGVRENVVFQAGGIIGLTTNPHILHAKTAAETAAEQMLTFSPGWNWVGFTFLPESHKVGDVLGKTGFTANDVIQTNGGSTRFMGTGWLPNSFTVDYGKLYQVYAANPVTVTISGDASSERSLPLISGWNWIANPTTTAVTPSQLTHSGGWTASDRIQSTNGTVIYTGSKWIPADGITLEPGTGCQIYTANEGTLTFPKVDEENALYAVVDLSGGPDAASYPVRYANTPPNLDDDTCRTTELWLRRIPKGTFIMGSPEDEVGRWKNETQHQVTLTQDYYIGVFECTQRQWELVMGTKPSYFNNPDYYETRPVEQVSYNMIRGTSATAGAGWPEFGHAVDTDSFMGRLQARTGLTFDLPTEAQWEYTCRAGTTTALNSGKNLTSENQDANMDEVGRYWYNGGQYWYNGYLMFWPNCTPANGTAKVGSYLPNAWGLYDMHGNVREWCLDRRETNELSTAAETDPVGPNTGSDRVHRGGGWYYDSAYSCRSAFRDYTKLSYSNECLGFRIALHQQQDLYAVIDLYAVVDLSGGPDATSYPVRYTNTAPNLDDDTCRTTELWLRKIPAGTFTMGSPEDEVGRVSDCDMAQHEVTLTQDFYIGVFECTQRQWELVMGNKPSYYNNLDYYATRPVERVTYSDIRGTRGQLGVGWPRQGHSVYSSSFMGRLNEKTGLTFDLPTEAQWEYACRAGTTTALNSGKNLTSTDQDANMDEVGRYWYNGGSEDSQDCAPTNGTAKVGSYLPNAWGLYDMHGNVWEWCLDWWGTSTSSTVAETDPNGPDTGSNRVMRGGGYGIYSYSKYAQHFRSAYRYYFSPANPNYDIGFRIAFLP